MTPRILCLHGFRGSASSLRAQLGELSRSAELVFIDAPGDGWWNATEDEQDPTLRHYEGWPRSRDAIIETFATRGPFDGILGFSQGAALAGLLTGLRSPPDNLAFAFAIMIGGFPARDRELAQLYARTDSYALPSLHLIGTRDRIVPPELSRDLAAKFASPTLVEHDGGHIIPAAAHAQIAAFIARC